jgi:hypothetical protein
MYRFVVTTETMYAQRPTLCHPSACDGTIYVDLFASFMQRCQFTNRFVSVDKDLLGLVQSSHLLYDLALAIGALEASRRASYTQLHASNRTYTRAFMLYGNALSALGREIAKTGAADREEVLWSTSLLGLFEVSSTHSNGISAC